MFNKKKYSIRKVSVGIVSVLIGIVAGSLGTVYAHEDMNNGVVRVEVNRNVDTEKTTLEEPEKTSKSTESVLSKPVLAEAVHKEGKLVESILEDKVNWNSIDEKEFVNYLLASIKVDKNKEQEMKTVWLGKVKELLAVNPNNENLKKVKSIIENTLKNEPSVEKEGEKEVPKEEKVTNDKKGTPKENKVSENKKEKNESVKENKKDTLKEQTLLKDKEVAPRKETSKVASSKQKATNDKKQETPTNTAKVENRVLLAKLSGRDVAVLFDKDKIKADNVFVGSINDESLNKTIIEKLGSEYKVVEVFEIHFEKDGKKLDSDVGRTVKMSVVKNDNAELEVYHIAENNELEKIKSSFNSGYIQFKINHFSKFTILERIRIGAKDLESRVQIVTPVKAEYRIESEEENYNNKDSNDKKEVYKKEKIEELSKTGLETTGLLEVSLLTLGVAVIIRRKQKQ